MLCHYDLLSRYPTCFSFSENKYPSPVTDCHLAGRIFLDQPFWGMMTGLAASSVCVCVCVCVCVYDDRPGRKQRMPVSARRRVVAGSGRPKHSRLLRRPRPLSSSSSFFLCLARLASSSCLFLCSSRSVWLYPALTDSLLYIYLTTSARGDERNAQVVRVCGLAAGWQGRQEN
jgi:hypothetical protein